MEKQSRVVYFDILNILACFAVIAMHCNGIVHNYSNTIAWKQSLIVEVISYWAVPIFFMLSGATLMEYRSKYSTKTFVKKRVEKTVLPFVIWSVIAFVYKSVTGAISITALSVTELITMFVTCQIENVYWFFVPLFAAYISIPVLAYLAKDTNKYLGYMLFWGIITMSILPFLCNVLGITYNTGITFPLTGGYILYVIFGYLLSKVELPLKTRMLLYLGGIFAAAVRYGGTYYLSVKNNSLNQIFWGYLNWPAVLLAAAVFVWFKYHEWSYLAKNEKLQKLIGEIAGASFGIYLIHIFVLNILRELLAADVYSLKWRTLGCVMVYFLSLIIVRILKKIPILRRIVP